MGRFLVRHVDHESGAELARFALPNLLAYEGIEYVYRQLFPAYQAAMTFQMGVAAPTPSYPNDRPNTGGGVGFGPTLTFAQCTNAQANEGGCYTSPMRTSFGYARQALNFTASMEADGGGFVSQEVTFPNNHSWSPQAAADWDFPWTPEEVEQPPPEWTPKESWEPEVGYRFARYAFGKTGSRYDALYCRPVLASLVKPTRRTTYADVSPHFHAHFGQVAFSSWTYVAGPPPRVESASAPQWTNTSGAAIGPFGWLAVYGSVGGSNELMWLTPIDPPVNVPNGDTLRVPGKVRFQLEGV